MRITHSRVQHLHALYCTPIDSLSSPGDARSAKPGVGGWRSGADGRGELEVRVAEAPADGAANEAVLKLLAAALGVSRSQLTIISGAASRHKRVAIPFDVAEARAARHLKRESMMFQVGKRRLGKERPRSLRHRPRLHGHVATSTAAGNEAESIATIHHALELRRHLPRYRRHVRPRHERGAGRPRASGPARPGVPRHQVRQSCAAPNGELLGHRRQARVCPRGLRGEPEAARHRRDRPLLPAPRRSRRADRGHGRRHGRAGDGGQGALPRPVRGGAATPSAARTRCIPIAALQTEYSLWSRDAGGRGAADLPRARHRLRRLLARSAAAFSPARSNRPTISTERLPPQRTRASRARTSRRTSSSSTRSRHGAARRAHRRRSSRWPGCWRRATTSCRSPAPSGVRYLDENIGALDVTLTADDLQRLDEILPPGAAAGPRYHERGMKTVNR